MFQFNFNKTCRRTGQPPELRFSFLKYFNVKLSHKNSKSMTLTIRFMYKGMVDYKMLDQYLSSYQT